jgi:Tfp pilus assembly protein PilF
LSLRHNQPELAIRILEEAKSRFPQNAAIPRSLGAAYYRSGDFKAAQTVLNQAIALDKSCALSYLLMGCTLSKLGQSAAAEEHFRQAQLLDPRYTVRR